MFNTKLLIKILLLSNKCIFIQIYYILNAQFNFAIFILDLN